MCPISLVISICSGRLQAIDVAERACVHEVVTRLEREVVLTGSRRGKVQRLHASPPCRPQLDLTCKGIPSCIHGGFVLALFGSNWCMAGRSTRKASES